MTIYTCAISQLIVLSDLSCAFSTDEIGFDLSPPGVATNLALSRMSSQVGTITGLRTSSFICQVYFRREGENPLREFKRR